jgi:hypothetical protein
VSDGKATRDQVRVTMSANRIEEVQAYDELPGLLVGLIFGVAVVVLACLFMN